MLGVWYYNYWAQDVDLKMTIAINDTPNGYVQEKRDTNRRNIDTRLGNKRKDTVRQRVRININQENILKLQFLWQQSWDWLVSVV